MKDGIRFLGIDDSPFSHEDDEAFLTGVVYRGTEFIEDIRKTGIEVDAEDATEKILELYEMCDNTRQIKAILIDGVSVAGFNVVDIDELAEETDKPVIAVTSNPPRPDKFRSAMKKSGNDTSKFEELPETRQIEMDAGESYMQFAGCGVEKATELVKISTLHGLTPEAIRVADMIGRAFTENL